MFTANPTDAYVVQHQHQHQKHQKQQYHTISLIWGSISVKQEEEAVQGLLIKINVRFIHVIELEQYYSIVPAGAIATFTFIFVQSHNEQINKIPLSERFIFLLTFFVFQQKIEISADMLYNKTKIFVIQKYYDRNTNSFA